MSACTSLLSSKEQQCHITSPPPQWLDDNYQMPEAYMAIGSGKHFEAAKNQALLTLAEMLQANVSKQTTSKVERHDDAIMTKQTVEQAITTDLTLGGYQLERYQQRSCQWNVMVFIDRITAQHLVNHHEAERIYQDLQTSKHSIREQAELMTALLHIAQSINYESINLASKRYLEQYQSLKQRIDRNRLQKNRQLRLIFAHQKANDLMPSDIQRKLLKRINVWGAYVPEQTTCESLEACLAAAKEDNAQQLFLVQIDRLHFSGNQSSIRRAELEVSIRLYEADAFLLEHQPLLLDAHVLTRLKSSLNWDILLQRLLQKHRLRLNDFHR